MPDVLQALLAAGAVPTISLPPTSRYADVGVTAHVRPPGPGEEPAPPVPYFRRRLCPPQERFALLHEYATEEGDRRDLVAAGLLGDPELWWRLADANGVIDPARMMLPPGHRLRITLPEGVPGSADA
ncbi:LysM domain-containing protein [Streptomyces sp. NPDC048604]|uniref:LysM domain-containing protein n=1 Tax=Streptomyces sp. NPDC048604 TaxID=3365578 RepID=UPI00371179C6